MAFFSPKAKGDYYEQKAARFLQKQGYHILKRNQSFKGAELDLICHKNQTLIFVEVRARGQNALAAACETINAAKIKRLIKGARLFLAQHPQYDDYALRFDIICFDDDQLTWIENAIEMDY